MGVPAPDDPGSDLPRAYVVRKISNEETPLDIKSVEIKLKRELIKFVADRVAAHKQLRGGIVFVEEIPKNAVGKFLRRELRDRAREEVVREREKMKARL